MLQLKEKKTDFSLQLEKSLKLDFEKEIYVIALEMYNFFYFVLQASLEHF